MEDRLGVVEVFEDVEELLHPRRVFPLQRHRVLRPHRHFGQLGLQARGQERGLHRLEAGLARQHFDRAVLVGEDVVGTGLERDLHHLVLARARGEHELTAFLELERDRALGAHA